MRHTRVQDLAITTSIIHELIESGNVSPARLDKLKKKTALDQGLPLVEHTALRDAYTFLVSQNLIKKNSAVEELLNVKPIRSKSGVAIVTLLTMPYPCPAKSVYCPTEARMPKSYIESEPAAARALALQFDPYLQTRRRIEVLERNGHPADKIEVILKGGTWSSYPGDYQQWFIAECFRAMNETGGSQRILPDPSPDSPYNRFVGKEKECWREDILFEEQKKNETAAHRCIGLTIETRPDWISVQEIKRLRLLGVTRVELGVQSPNDEILKLIKRGHLSKTVFHATKLLKDAGLKVDYHLMPGLPGASPAGDLSDAQRIFTEEGFQPDTVKLYPCVVTPSAELEQWRADGRYVPYTTEQLISLLADIKTIIPPHVRIARVIRDIPSQEISGGNTVTNLRQTIQKYMKERGMVCRCLRCREVGHKRGVRDQGLGISHYKERMYNASGGTEYFLSYESDDESILYAFLRLRLPSPDASVLWNLLPELEGAALIREVHTYGQLVRIKKSEEGASQHKGMGKKLVLRAETIALSAGYKKIAVIAGIGVREYYAKIGYGLEGTYMVKHQ